MPLGNFKSWNLAEICILLDNKARKAQAPRFWNPFFGAVACAPTGDRRREELGVKARNRQATINSFIHHVGAVCQNGPHGRAERRVRRRDPRQTRQRELQGHPDHAGANRFFALAFAPLSGR